MAICQFCEREMTTASTCSVEAMHRDGVRIEMLPNGTETHCGGPGKPVRCHDCGVAPGGFHHLGCDWQQCPVCGGQMFTCGCRFDEDGDLDDDDDEWVPLDLRDG